VAQRIQDPVVGFLAMVSMVGLGWELGKAKMLTKGPEFVHREVIDPKGIALFQTGHPIAADTV
jgi:hypothetical protein